MCKWMRQWERAAYTQIIIPMQTRLICRQPKKKAHGDIAQPK